MTRIKIQDLPRDLKISQAELKSVLGGIDTVPLPERPSLSSKEPLPAMYLRRFTLADPRPTPAAGLLARKK